MEFNIFMEYGFESEWEQTDELHDVCHDGREGCGNKLRPVRAEVERDV